MDLRKYQREAYQAVLRAVALGELGWDTEDVLAKLRITLSITDELHKELRDKVQSDAEVRSLKRGLLYDAHGGMSMGNQPQAMMGMQGSGQMMSRGQRGPPASQLSGRPSLGRNYMGQPQAMMPSTPSARSGVGGAQRGVPLGMNERSSHLGLGSAPQQQGAVAGAPLSKPLNARGTMARASAPPSMRDVKPEAMSRQAPASFVKGAKAKASAGSSKASLSDALPPGLDLLKSNLQGLRVRRYLKSGPGYSEGWYFGIIAHVRDLANGRACHIVYDLDTPNMTWERDYIFRLSKANREWQILDERVDRDWSKIQPPPDKKAGSSKKRKSTGMPALSTAPLNPMGSLLSSELGSLDLSRIDTRVVDGSQAPYRAAALNDALADASNTGDVKNLNLMLGHIHKRRSIVVEQIAKLELQQDLQENDAKTVEAMLHKKLAECRNRITIVQNEIFQHH